MKLLVEDWPYREELVGRIFPIEQSDKGRVTLSGVGYYFNSAINDCVFILPKVILDKDGRVFGQYAPEEIINISAKEADGKIAPKEREFLYGFSVWVFRALCEYRRLNPKSTILREKNLSDLDMSHAAVESTWLELMLAILRCCDENRDYFMFVTKNIHSGHNRINWRKTIATKQAYLTGIEDGAPHAVYPSLVNRKKQINFDEQLLVIFFSIVRHICDTYGFRAHVNLNYELIRGAQFERLLKGRGKALLRRIKYKYFSDKALAIWGLCYRFFDRAELINSSIRNEEWLMAHSFHNVFEAMVDELIGDKDLPSGLKEQKDGKILDHIYKHRAIINPEENIWHIADSKYYKTDEETKGESHFKQYTYARNVIQHHIDNLLRHPGKTPGATYRDELTEGYNITPNFFISAKIDGERKYGETNLRQLPPDSRAHFVNRLFERDTLWLSHYSINFLYVLSVYAAGHDATKERFRRETRRVFRDAFVKLINDNYEFWTVELPPGKMRQFVDSHFRMLNGKLYHFADTLILALERDRSENTSILAAIDQEAPLAPFTLR